MKIALCTTTIHVPHALKLMRKCSGDVKFFVAIDEKTPKEIFDLEVENTAIVHLGNLKNWKCSDAIGANTLARRNIAFLESLAWGADVIYSWDNDNLPINTTHFFHHDKMWYDKFNGIKIEKMHADAWFDPGRLLIPPMRHRGFPHHKMDKGCRAEPVIDAKIGVMAGLIIGNPDIDASTRIELKPDIAQAHLLGQAGIVVDPRTWSVFNTQNTAVIRELVPAWFLMPNVGRHDDIYASLIVQRVARERDLHVHFGPPFCYQQRNEHNLITDLRAEIDGMENTEKLAALLDSISLPAKSVIEDTRIIYEALMTCGFIPEESAYAGLVWLEDCEGVI